jgi:hypothetical protein
MINWNDVEGSGCDLIDKIFYIHQNLEKTWERNVYLTTFFSDLDSIALNERVINER